MAEAIALVSAALSYGQAVQSNKSAAFARDQQIASQTIAANQRKALTGRSLAGTLGSIRASAAGRGVAGSASVFAEALSNIETGQMERSNIELNRQIANAQAQARYASQYTNPLLAGIKGGAEGYMLASGLGAESMFASSATAATTTSSAVGGAVGAPGTGIFFPNAIPGAII